MSSSSQVSDPRPRPSLLGDSPKIDTAGEPRKGRNRDEAGPFPITGESSTHDEEGKPLGSPQHVGLSVRLCPEMPIYTMKSDSRVCSMKKQEATITESQQHDNDGYGASGGTSASSGFELTEDAFDGPKGYLSSSLVGSCTSEIHTDLHSTLSYLMSSPMVTERVSSSEVVHEHKLDSGSNDSSPAKGMELSHLGVAFRFVQQRGSSSSSSSSSSSVPSGEASKGFLRTNFGKVYGEAIVIAFEGALLLGPSGANDTQLFPKIVGNITLSPMKFSVHVEMNVLATICTKAKIFTSKKQALATEDVVRSGEIREWKRGGMNTASPCLVPSRVASPHAMIGTYPSPFPHTTLHPVRYIPVSSSPLPRDENVPQVRKRSRSSKAPGRLHCQCWVKRGHERSPPPTC